MSIFAKKMIRMDRREFLKKTAVVAGGILLASPLASVMASDDRMKQRIFHSDEEDHKMTYRVHHGSGDKVSLLGFGMMRLPDSQEKVNQLVDYAISHGVNYFDTAPMYKGGRNEAQTGQALNRYPREKYFVATKMSNYDRATQQFDNARKMYENSFRELRVDYIDYYLLHGVGGSGMDELRRRYLDNGILDFLLREREAGRIRHLGFSYHGNVEVFDFLLDHQHEYHWDFAQIQMNYLDWRHALLEKGGWKHDADAEYLYNKMEKTGVQTIVMEPLRGGSLAKMRDILANRLKALRPDDSLASWAMRWVGSHPNILTTLSGMNEMSHLEDNIHTFSPLDPCTESENRLLEEIADVMAGFPVIPCTTCRYCMPCPFGVDIPGNFAYYNETVEKQILPLPDKTAADYLTRKQQFTEGLKKALPDTTTWAGQCVGCEACLKKCPQQIRIPNQMARIVETMGQ
ncbi:MAG: aldo/keto reductase [Bacteroidales bacterium]|nr:aldo/keto reductase [Bacteroidales bacterium]